MRKLKLAVVAACGWAAVASAGTLVEDLTVEAAQKGIEAVTSSPYATGGDLILKDGNEYVHVFTNAAAATDFVVGDTALVGKVLLVGGGGGSGAGWKPAGWNFCTGGGGGGGGVATHDFLALYAGKTYAVTVGAGGAGGTTAAPGATGGASSLSGNGLDLSVLGGGGGGSGGSTDTAISSGTTGATGGGASGYVQNGGGTAVVGTPGGSGDTAGGAATVERNNNLDRNVAGGGGGGAGGVGQPGRHENGTDGAVVGGAGLASDIFGFSVAFGGGGAGGSYSVNGGGTFRNLATDGGGSSCADSYGEQYAYAGADGYGGGAAGAWFTGGRSSPQNGLKGGSGLVAIRYAASTVELDPALPMVRFDAAAASGETSVSFNWLLRTFGDGADGAKIGVEWGRDGQEKDHDTVLVASASLGAGTAELAEGLLPGRVYSFRLYAENSAGKRGYANEVKVVATQGGKSAWKESEGAQNKANGLIVDFSAKIGYVGENESTVTFRWKFAGGAWQEESLGAFDKANPPPSAYKVQKMFLDYDVVSYEFVVRNAAADISWTDVASGRVAMSDGKINESYWATKDLGIAPVLNASKTKTVTQEKTKVQREYNYYTHEQDPAWGETYTGTDTFIVAKPVGGDAEGRPLCVFLHGRGGSAEGISGDFLKEDGVYNAPDDFYCIFLDNGRGNGAQNLSFRYWWGATGNWRGPEVEGVASYREEPATAKRVLDCVEWLVREKKIDRNRIYMAGNSMGGQGTLAIGLTHGEVFAAIEGNVPATVWYTAARMNFVDDAGIIRNVEDRDATAFVDPPPCFDWSGSDDGWSRQHEVLLESMNRFRYSYSVLWGKYGHCGSFTDARKRNDLVGKYDWKWIRKNAAYPCFSNATGNDTPPWPWATVTYAKNAYFYDDIQVSGITYSDGATTDGQRNAYFRWENVSDTAEAMKMRLWVATAEEAGTTMFTVPESQTADVTIRRVQGFKLLKDQPCAWTFGGQSGTAKANAEGVVTVNLTMTHEQQELTLEPRPFAYLVAKSSVCTVGEREISVIANVQALGGAAKATITADYRAANETEWTHLTLGEQGEGPALYTIGSLTPNVKYAVKVTIDNGQDAPIETNLGNLTTLYYTLTANAALDTVTESSVAVAVGIEEIGTLASEAAVKILYRADSATAWTTKDCGTQKRGNATYAIGGLDSGVKYWFKATVDNGVDAPAEFVLGSAVTLVAGDRTLVEPPVIRDVKFTGAAVKATVPASELWTVVANAGGTAAGRYTVTLRLTDATHNRWIGSATDTIELAYNIVESIPGLTLPAGAEWFSEKGDVVISFREGENAPFELAYDAYADILLVAGGGPGGMASTWQNGLPGAGGGAGGMLEQSGVTLAGGSYTVTVGQGGTPGTDHGKQNNKGGDSRIVGKTANFTAVGGGGGGHASTADGQSAAACGANGGSSGGSLLSLAWGYWSPAITADACKTYCTPGQGNPGGRISTGGSSLWVGAVGGGGAGEPAPWADTKNPTKTEFLAGGAGKASSITGESVVYAAGGDGGDLVTTTAKNGADGFGGGGQGGCLGSGAVGEPGRGGDGIVVIRLKEYFLSGCAHAHTHVTQAGSAPTCTEGGFTDVIVCDDCGLTLTQRTALPPNGHHYENDYCTVCGAESRFHKIEQLYWSNDRRYVFVDAHRGMTNEVAGIPHSSAAAFRYAIEIGADVIELDPKPTADGVIIVMHDANMEPEVYGPVSGIVGSGATANWAGQIENYILRKGPNTNEPSDQHVLTMAEALDICKDQCFLQIDCNYWTINCRMDQLWDLICEKGMQRQCIFIKDNLKDWPRYQQQGAPEGMIFQNEARRDGGTLNQNQPDGFNDRSSFPDPTKFGWQRVMDQGSTIIMTDTAEALIGYLDTLGRHTLEPETDTRRMVTPLIPSDIAGVKGKTRTYGATDTADYTVVSDEGGSEKGEYFVTLRLKDPATTRWTDTTDGDKKMWYHFNEIDASSIDGLPTDFEGQTAEYPTTGSANGLSWANAVRAYAIGDETVLIFSDPAATTSFRVLDGYDAAGRYLLVGGGGPGGMNGTHKAHQAGSGGGAGGMLEGTVAKLASGAYAVTVGAGGKPGTDHGKANNKGGDSVVAGGAVEWRAFGGGGGGHGSTGDNQKLAARGVNGGSSGGSQFYYDTEKYGSMWSITDVDWLASFVEGQGHHGGRVAGYKASAMQIATAGGGGAGDHARAPGEEQGKPGNSTMENAFGTGGAGRASDITGMSITYAGGGAGGTVTSVSTQRVAGGFGGGGSTDFSRSDFTGAGVDMLGGGGAGASYKNGTTDLPGRGGSGVVIVRLTTAANGDCTHPTVSVTKEAVAPTCIEKGWTAEKTCDTCHKVVEPRVAVPALGHDFTVEVERVEPTATRAGQIVRKCSRCEERQTTPLPPTGGGTALLPTVRPSSATSVESDDVEGVEWSGASAAWRLSDGVTTVLVFTNAESAASFTVANGFMVTADVLAVGGGGAGGSAVAGESGAGGAAGAMVETYDQLFDSGDYAITVGAGGVNADGGESSVCLKPSTLNLEPATTTVVAEGGAAGAESGKTEYGGWGGDGAGEPGHRPLGSEPGEGTWLGGNGGAGKVAYLTGAAVTYAGGGAGGSVGWADYKQTSGGAGGGGGTVENCGSATSDNGVDGLGGGGAGTCSSSAGSAYVASEPGRGGNGVVVICITAIEVACDHETIETIPAVAPNCTTAGSTEGRRCTACGYWLAKIQELPALGHLWDGGVITQVPTADAPGTITYTCQREGCEVTRTAAVFAPAESGAGVPVRQGWSFTRDKEGKSGWEPVELPHDWAIAGPFEPETDGSTGKLPWKGEACYRRHFAPEELKGENFELEFEGVMARSRVFVNGEERGGSDYGYVGYRVALGSADEALEAGGFDVLVKVDTLAHESRWYPGAGIYRDVLLRCWTGERVIPGTMSITTRDISEAQATVDVSCETTRGPTNFSFVVEHPRLWDIGKGELYELELLGEKFRYGIRTAEFTADQGFFLNGRRVEIRGACLHSDLGILGMAFNRSAARRQLEILREMGMNAVRTAHNAPAPELLDLCDEMGFIVWDECFDKWDATAGRESGQNLETYVTKYLDLMVRRDRNHPSIVIWSIGNEIDSHTQNSSNPDGTTRERCRRFRETIRALDVTRPVSIASCAWYESVLAGGEYDDLDVVGWNYCGRYSFYHERRPNQPVIESESASCVAEQGWYNDVWPVNKYDFSADRRHVDASGRCAPGWGDPPDRDYERMARDTYCAGQFVWTGIDYLGENWPICEGNESHVGEIPVAEQARSSYFGACDLLGLPKEQYWNYRANWRDDVETLQLSPMHWTFPGREGKTRPVQVYTSFDTAELFVNGKSYGKRTKDSTAASGADAFWGDDCTDPTAYYKVLSRYRLLWPEVVYEPGEVTVVAYDENGQEVLRRTWRTAGAATQVVVEPEQSEIPNDGESLVFVKVSAVDANGTVVPDATNRVSFAVSGPLEIVSVGNADPRGLESFKEVSSHPLHCGVAGLFVRRTGEGPVRLTATVDGLATGSFPVCAHTEAETVPAVAPTCTTAGSTEGRRCKACGFWMTPITEIPLLGHAWGEWTVTPATCLAAGEETRTCARCKVAETNALAQLEHAYDAGVITQEATCETAGQISFTCTNGCHSVSNEVIAALGHLWDEGVVTQEATTNAPGTITYTCQREGEGEGVTTRTEEIPQLPCNWFDVKFADYAPGAAWTMFGSLAPDGGTWTLVGGEETTTEVVEEAGGRRLDFANVTSLVYRASKPSLEKCATRVSGRVLVPDSNELPTERPTGAKAGLTFVGTGANIDVYAQVGDEWRKLEGSVPGLEAGKWIDYQADFDLAATNGAPTVRYTLGGTVLTLDGKADIELPSATTAMSGVAYVGTGSIRDFKGSYWLKASPIIPISPTDAPVLAAQGLIVDGSSGRFALTIENPVEGLYYAVFTAEKLTDEFVAEVVTEAYAPGMGEDGKLTLEVAMDGTKSSKFARVVVSSRPVKVGDRY